MTDLKPCPFCGSDRLLIYGPSSWNVECCACNCQGPAKDYRDEAIAAWNERVER